MAEPESWHAFYYAAWQWPCALLVVPFLYLMHRAATLAPRGGVVPQQAPFMSGALLIFAFLTMLDPIATGPIAKALGSDTASTALGLTFVLVGDFRVYLLVFHLLTPADGLRANLLRASGFTAIVPVLAYLVNLAAGAVLGEVPGQVLWLAHELAFVTMALWLARVHVPARLGTDGERSRFLRTLLGYVAGYYGLWASADVMILAGLDEGWAVRLVPNQLYYAFFVPFVHLRFFGSGSQADTSASSHASR